VDRVAHPAGHGGRRDEEERVGPPRRVEHRGQSRDDDLVQQRDERDHREHEAHGEQHRGGLVLELPAAGDRQEGLRRLGGLGEICRGRGHQPLTFPPDTERAMRLTMNVRMKSTRPAAMYAPVGSGWLNSALAEAIFEAKVKPPSKSDRALGVLAARRMMSTATVSPSARPRASIEPAIMPDLAYGKQVIRIFSHLVAPSARAASWWSDGVWRMVSRDMEVMIGRIMIASTTPAVKIVPPP